MSLGSEASGLRTHRLCACCIASWLQRSLRPAVQHEAKGFGLAMTAHSARPLCRLARFARFAAASGLRSVGFGGAAAPWGRASPGWEGLSPLPESEKASPRRCPRRGLGDGLRPRAASPLEGLRPWRRCRAVVVGFRGAWGSAGRWRRRMWRRRAGGGDGDVAVLGCAAAVEFGRPQGDFVQGAGDDFQGLG